MISHVNRKDMAAYVADRCTPGEDRRIAAHLAGCASCRQRHAALIAVISGVDPVAEPPSEIRTRLVRAWYERNAAAASVSRPPRIGWLLPVGAAAALILVVAGVILLNRYDPETRGEPYPLSVTDMRGAVQSSGKAVRAGTRIASGPRASFALTIGTVYRLDCGENTDVEIISADTVRGLRIRLNSGIVLSTAEGFSRYGYHAAGFELIPAGTRFRITCAEALVTAVVRDGAVAVRVPGKPDSIINAGQGWSSAHQSVLPVADSALAHFFGEAPVDAGNESSKDGVALERPAVVPGDVSTDAVSKQSESERQERAREDLLRERREQIREREDSRREMRQQRRRGE